MSSRPDLTEIVSQNLLVPLLETLEALLELTAGILRDAYPEVLAGPYPPRAETAASAYSTAIFNYATALEDTVRALRHHLEDLEAAPSPPSSSDFPF